MKKHLLILSAVVFLSLNTMSQNWVQMASYPGTLPNSPMVYFTLSNTIYTLNQSDRTLWQYNPANNTWVTKNNFPGPQRDYGVAMTIGSKAYYGTGGDGFGGNLRNDFWEYNPVTDSWLSIDNIPESCYWATAFSIGSKGYVTMGLTNMVNVSDKLWEYDAVTGNWTQKNNIPFPTRYVGNALSVAGSGYIGFGYSGTLNTWFDDIYEYDPVNDSWFALNPFPYGGRCQSTATADGNIVYIGLGNQAMTQFSDVYSVDISTGIWSTLPSLPGGGRVGALGYVINGKLYMGLGTASLSLNDLWSLDISSGINEAGNDAHMYWYVSADATVSIVFNGKFPDVVEVYDVTGRLVLSDIHITESLTELHLGEHGAYFLRYRLDGRDYVKKLVL